MKLNITALACALLLLVGSQTLFADEKVDKALQKIWNRLPVASVSTKLEDCKFQMIDLSKSAVEVDGKTYHALRFTTPAYQAQLSWAFRLPKGFTRWWIVPAKGGASLDQYPFTRILLNDIEGLGKRGSKFQMINIHESGLNPGTDYIIRFQFDHTEQVFTIPVSINVFPPTETMDFRKVYAPLYQ